MMSTVRESGEFDSGKLVTAVALVIVTSEALCEHSKVHSVATCSSPCTPVEGGLTMATLKSEVNISRLKQGHISSESVCDNGIGTFAISFRGYQQLPGVQEVRVRHFMCQGSVQNFLTKSNRNFEVKKKKKIYIYLTGIRQQIRRRCSMDFTRVSDRTRQKSTSDSLNSTLL